MRGNDQPVVVVVRLRTLLDCGTMEDIVVQAVMTAVVNAREDEEGINRELFGVWSSSRREKKKN